MVYESVVARQHILERIHKQFRHIIQIANFSCAAADEQEGETNWSILEAVEIIIRKALSDRSLKRGFVQPIQLLKIFCLSQNRQDMKWVRQAEKCSNTAETTS